MFTSQVFDNGDPLFYVTTGMLLDIVMKHSSKWTASQQRQAEVSLSKIHQSLRFNETDAYL